MNDSVFFVVEPISWQNPFSFSHFIIAIICSIAFYILFCLIEKFCNKKIIQKIAIEKNIVEIPEIYDTNFCNNSFIFLQNFVTENYLPKNAFAHTYEDITKYCNNEKILQLYKYLETQLFQKKNLSTDEKIFIKNTLLEIISQK